MHANIIVVATTLSDTDLLRRVTELAGRERRATVELVAHLAEVDRRKLHREQGYGSLFSYCTEALRLSEHATFNRIEAARASRAFPVILDLLAEGAVNLSTVRLVAPHLTPENHLRVLEEARGRSKREVEVMVARLAPRPDVAASVRKLPTPPTVRAAAPAVAAPAPVTHVEAAAPAEVAASRPVLSPAEAVPARPITPPSPPRPVVAPLTPERYRIQFTVSRETQEKLRRVQDLLRREIPDGDPAAIFDRALTVLLREVERRKMAATQRPRPQRATDPHSRYVSAQDKRAIWHRDESQCAFVAQNGRRCRQRVFLEVHHLHAHGHGGETTAANLALYCRAHNVHEAERLFGPWSQGVREPGASYSIGGGTVVTKHNQLCPTRPGASWPDGISLPTAGAVSCPV